MYRRTLAVLLACCLFVPAARGQEGDAHPRSAGARIERVAGADEFFDLLGQEAYCFDYYGSWIECWIEVEIDGKVTRLGEGLLGQLRAAAGVGPDGPLPGGKLSGSLIWVRRRVDQKEVWDLAISLTQSGRGSSIARLIGISPPHPSTARTYVEGVEAGGPLSGGQEVELASFETIGEQAGQVTRSAKLKCKAVK